MRIYISGKITGLAPDEAAKNFESGEQKVRETYAQRQVEVVNPIKIDHPADATWHDFMAKDLKELLTCDGIYMLKNWGDSRGARCEYMLAKELDLVIIFEQ